MKSGYIREDIKQLRIYSVSEHLYMLPSDMKLKIKTGTVGYNNKILVSDGKFILGKNEKVNSLEAPSAPQAETPAISHKDSNLVKQTADSETAVIHKDLEKKVTIAHEEEKIALILSLTGIFTIWYLFQ